MISFLPTQKYNIKNQSFGFNGNTHFYRLFETNIENNFNIGDILNISNYIYYEYGNIKNDYFCLEHEYNIYMLMMNYFLIRLYNIKIFI